jgi:hypothetical protein
MRTAGRLGPATQRTSSYPDIGGKDTLGDSGGWAPARPAPPADFTAAVELVMLPVAVFAGDIRAAKDKAQQDPSSSRSTAGLAGFLSFDPRLAPAGTVGAVPPLPDVSGA